MRPDPTSWLLLAPCGMTLRWALLTRTRAYIAQPPLCSDDHTLRAHYPLGAKSPACIFSQGPSPIREIGAILSPTLWSKTLSLSNAVYSNTHYAFSFQREPHLKEWEGSVLSSFSLLIHNLLGLRSRSRKPSNSIHFNIKDIFLCAMCFLWAQTQKFARAILFVLTQRRRVRLIAVARFWFGGCQVQLHINNITWARMWLGDIANSDCNCFARTAFNTVSCYFTNPWTAQGFFTPPEVMSDFWEHLQSRLAKVKESSRR